VGPEQTTCAIRAKWGRTDVVKTFKVEMVCTMHNTWLHYFGPVDDSSTTDLFFVQKESDDGVHKAEFGIDFSEVDCPAQKGSNCKNDNRAWKVRIVESD
jgi:hypothetical protein